MASHPSVLADTGVSLAEVVRSEEAEDKYPNSAAKCALKVQVSLSSLLIC